MSTVLGVLLPIVMLALIVYGGCVAFASGGGHAGIIIAGFGFVMLALFHCTEMLLRELRKP